MKRLMGAGFGLVVLAVGAAGPASAQYYRNDDRAPSYDRGERYDRGYRDDRRDDGARRRGDDTFGERRGGDPYGQRRGDAYGERRGNGFDRDDAPRGGRAMQPANPMAGMSIEDQKRAVKNHREAQKKALRNGIVIP